VALQPNDAQLRAHFGMALQALGRYEEAASQLSEAERLRALSARTTRTATVPKL
jgi:Tfp pilus assembly protein PilF